MYIMHDNKVHYPAWVFVVVILASILTPILVAYAFAIFFAPFMA